MLVEFSVGNFRSILDPVSILLAASSGKELRETHTFDSGIASVDRLVRSTALYGPNAAGKTNVLLALQFLQNLVVNSATAFQPGVLLPYTPFKFSTASRKKPSTFEVTFIQNKVLYEYGLAVDADRVHEEWLVAYPESRPQRLFERKFERATKAYKWKFSANLRGGKNVWRDATRPNALFLSTAIHLNNTQLIPVFEWFQKRLVVIAGVSHLNAGLTVNILDLPDGKKRVLPFLRAADLGIGDIEIRREPLISGLPIQGSGWLVADPGKPPSLVRITLFHDSEKSKEKVPLDVGEESSGTQALIRGAGAWLNVLAKAEVIFFDEIDTSLHPLLTRFLVGLFNSNITNRNNAQLIMTTHDTSLLDDDVFRRDQIWFVEKDRLAHTKLTPLTDFSPRKGEAIERGYLRGRYGALPIVSELSPNG